MASAAKSSWNWHAVLRILRHRVNVMHELCGDSLATDDTDGHGHTLPHMIETLSGVSIRRLVIHGMTTDRHGLNTIDRTGGGLMDLTTGSGKDDDPYKTQGDLRATLCTPSHTELFHNGGVTYGTEFTVPGSILRLDIDGDGPAYTDGVLPAGTDRMGLSPLMVLDSQGFPNRDFEIIGKRPDQGATRLTFNPSTDGVAYLHASLTGGVGMVRRMPRAVMQVADFAGSIMRAYLYDKERRTSAATTAIGSPGTPEGNLVISGWELVSLDENDNRIAGPSFVQRAAGSWNIADYATAGSPDGSNPRRYTDSQLQHFKSAINDDTTEQSLIWMILRPESLTADATAALVTSFMAREEAADALIGKPRPHFAFVLSHMDGVLSQSAQEAWYAGIEQAIEHKPNASAINMAALLDWTNLDGTDQATQDKIAEFIDDPTSLAFAGSGTVDVSGGGWLDAQDIHMLNADKQRGNAELLRGATVAAPRRGASASRGRGRARAHEVRA